MRQGFTLVELSIVIIIIGFLIAGIAGGSSLLQSAKLTSIITEVQSVQSAVQQFSSIYGDLPGDMTKATSFFGTTDKNGFTVHNGNGDGYIGYSGVGQVDTQEGLAAPQELALAGLIPGVYSGQTDANGTFWNTLTPGKNIIPSKADGGYWFVGDNPWGDYPQAINFLTPTFTLKALDSSFIDQKLDDGKPLTGKVLSFNLLCGTSSSNCTSTNTCSGGNSSFDQTVPYQLGNGSSCSTTFIVEEIYVPK